MQVIFIYIFFKLNKFKLIQFIIIMMILFFCCVTETCEFCDQVEYKKKKTEIKIQELRIGLINIVKDLKNNK